MLVKTTYQKNPGLYTEKNNSTLDDLGAGR